MNQFAVLLLTAGMALMPAWASDKQPMYVLEPLHLHSVITGDPAQEYFLLVSLPTDYSSSNASYPAVYLLDGGIMLPMLGAYARALRAAEDLPDLIVVGISYGTADWRTGNARSHDYTAPAVSREHYGGAAQFQQTLATRIIQLVESNYRANSGQRFLYGQSLGGQFVINTRFNNPDLFRGYIASNPALHRNLDYYLGLAPQPAAGEAPQLIVVRGQDDEHRFRNPSDKWLDHWQGDSRLAGKLHHIDLPGHNHFSIAPAAFRLGLMKLLDE